MHIQQIILAIINVVGGILVISSYVQGIKANPQNSGDAWGGVPKTIKPVYIASMLLAAAGYFAFTYFVLFELEPDKVEIADFFDFRIFHVIYALILIPSAIWMPLTFAMLGNPRRSLWWAIRITLAVVGLASLSLLAALVLSSPKDSTFVYWLSIAGIVAFCVQTALLDALIWPAYFPVKR